MREEVDKIALKAFHLAVKHNGSSVIIRLITDKEKITLGRRLLIAQAILSGKTRFEINNEIGVSPNTFAQINRWLETEFGEYTSAHLSSKQTNKKAVSRYVKPFSYEHLQRKYPAHFLIFSLTEDLLRKK